MNKDDTLQVIVDDYELVSHDNYMICGLNDEWDNSWDNSRDKSRNECKKILQSTVSRLQSEKDDANLYNKRKLQSQILILEQVMEEL